MYNKYLLILLLLILQGCEKSNNSPVPSIYCTAIINWEIPIERTDGSELLLEDINKYTVFINVMFGTNSNTLEQVIDITDSSLTQWIIPKIKQGEHWIYMTVTDDEGRESTFSNELSKKC